MELTELVDEINDITDPKCMDNLLDYLEKLQEKDEDFMQLLISKLDRMCISWAQPWYQRSNCLTRPLQYEEAEDTFKTESFSKEEQDRVAKNWKNFRKVFNVPNTPICLARWKNRRKSRTPKTAEEQVRQFVTAFLAQGLERNLYQVHIYFRSHYGAPVRGPYTKTEEKIMQICLHHKPSNVVPLLAAILGREPRGINKKLKALSEEKSETKRIKWTLKTATKLVKSLMKHSNRKLTELKCAEFNPSVWLKVQEDMDCHRENIRRFWYNYLHVQLYVKYDVKLKRLRKKIFKKIKHSPYQVWSDIQWKNVVREFPDGFTHHFLYQCVYSLLRRCTDNLPATPLHDVIELGFSELQKPKKKNKRRLKTLALNDEGNLEYVHHSIKLP